MKKLFLLITLFFLVLSNAHSFFNNKISFTKKPKLNSVLNNLYEGQYYSCQYSGKSYSSGYQDIKSGFFNNREANNTIEVIKNKNYLGVIYQKINRWSQLHRIYEHSFDDLFYLGPDYHYGDDYKSSSPDKWWKLNFNSKELIINPHYTYASDYYSCSKLNLSENEKKYFISKFTK
jgi:hypothetical protein